MCMNNYNLVCVPNSFPQHFCMAISHHWWKGKVFSSSYETTVVILVMNTTYLYNITQVIVVVLAVTFFCISVIGLNEEVMYIPFSVHFSLRMLIFDLYTFIRKRTF